MAGKKKLITQPILLYFNDVRDIFFHHTQDLEGTLKSNNPFHYVSNSFTSYVRRRFVHICNKKKKI